MIEQIDLNDLAQLEELWQLQKAAYLIEANLIGFYDIPPLKDTLNSLQNCNEIFYGYFIDNTLTGAISYKFLGELLDIHRMVVSPAHFRQGIAGKLLNFLLDEQVTTWNIKKVIVSTGAKNEPAKQLYQRFGFREVAQPEVLPGLFISQFEKIIN